MASAHTSTILLFTNHASNFTFIQVHIKCTQAQSKGTAMMSACVFYTYDGSMVHADDYTGLNRLKPLVQEEAMKHGYMWVGVD